MDSRAQMDSNQDLIFKVAALSPRSELVLSCSERRAQNSFSPAHNSFSLAQNVWLRSGVMADPEGNVQFDEVENNRRETGIPLGGGHTDPLFLANSDHPGMQLVASQLSGTNFHTWRRGVRMALGAKVKLGFINGGCPKPSELDDNYDKWLRCDFMVMSWLINSMKPEIAENFMFVHSAKELWDEILEQFAESNAPLIYQLRRELSGIKQDNLSVSEYYGKCKKIWEELQALENVPVCKCGALKSCTCQILKSVLEKEATTKLMQFLMGLSDTYEHVRSSILGMDPLPTVNRALHMVTQIERAKGITGGLTQNHDILAASRAFENAKGKSTDFKRDAKRAKMDRVCTYCKEKGHLRETCFQLVGIPEWYTGPKGKPGDKPGQLVANVQDVQQDNPLDGDQESRSSAQAGPSHDMSLVNAVVAEVMKAIHGKVPTEGPGPQGFINFAGHFN